jgi:hypothetical protein
MAVTKHHFLAARLGDYSHNQIAYKACKALERYLESHFTIRRRILTIPRDRTVGAPL